MLARSSRSLVPLTLLLLAACGTDPLSQGGNGTPVLVDDGSGDGSGLDGGQIEFDAGSEPGNDTGNPTLDVGLSDGGNTNDSGIVQVCEPRSTECDGDVLLTCAGDGSGFGRTRCAAFSQVCRINDEGVAACVDDQVVGPGPDCDPGELACAPDGATLLACAEDGTFTIAEECRFGCDPDTLECSDEPVDPGTCDLEVDELEFEDDSALVFTVDLCGEGNDAGYLPNVDGDCGDYSSPGEDLIFSFDVSSTAVVTVEIRDDDDSAAIDTVAYLRAACDASESQLACGDDVPCDEAPSDLFGSCSNGEQVRVSRLEQLLEPGTYFLVVDSFNYNSRAGSFGCGDVRVTISLASPDASALPDVPGE